MTAGTEVHMAQPQQAELFERDVEDRAELYLEARATITNAAAREIELVASTESLDSHGTILRQNWRLDRFKANPVILYAHDRRSIPVARATRIKVEGAKGSKRLVIGVKFRDAGKDPIADQVWSAMEDEFLRGVSVGFRSHTQKWETHNDSEVLVLDDNELYEVSIVSVPSNADTLAKIRARAEGQRDNNPPPDRGAPKDNRTMNAHLSMFARSVGLDEAATDEQIRPRLSAFLTDREKLIAATGEQTVDAAIGVIAAGKTATDRVKQLEQEAETKERDGILATLRAEGKVTPAMEAEDGFIASLSLESLRAYAKTAPRVVPEASKSKEAKREGSQASTVRITDETRFEDLSNTERANLKREDEETYKQLREDWIARGRPTKGK